MNTRDLTTTQWAIVGYVLCNYTYAIRFHGLQDNNVLRFYDEGAGRHFELLTDGEACQLRFIFDETRPSPYAWGETFRYDELMKVFNATRRVIADTGDGRAHYEHFEKTGELTTIETGLAL